MKMNFIRYRKTSLFGNSFTLIEMLVVIAIIVILAAMLQPSMMKAVGMAKSTACANNVSQIGVGVFMYVGDYNGWLPITQNITLSQNAAWKYETGPYVIGNHSRNLHPNADIAWCSGQYLCPLFESPDTSIPYQTSARKGGYGWNYYYAGFDDTQTDGRTRKRATQMKKPGITVLCGDAEGSDVNPPVHVACWPYLFPPTASANILGMRHQGAINVLWGDSHVRPMLAYEILNNGRIDGHTNDYYFLLEK